MAKLPATWTALDGSTTATQNSGYLLLETGDTLLLEDGASFLLLEDVSLTPKEDTAWLHSPTKYSSSWVGDGTTTYTAANSGVQRVAQDGVTIRTAQDGTIRIAQENVSVSKSKTTWDNL